MLNTEKIRLMTKLSLYEKKNESKALKAGKYYRSDFISLGLLNSAIVATLAFFIVLSLVIFVNIEELLSVITTLDFMEVGKVLVSSYLIYLLSYLMIVYVVYRLKYERMTKEIKEYDATLKELYMIYKKEDNSSHEVAEQRNVDEEVAEEASLDEEADYENNEEDDSAYEKDDSEYDEKDEEEYEEEYDEEYDGEYEEDYREIDEDELERTLDDKYGMNMYLEQENKVTEDTVTLIDLSEEEYEDTDSEVDSMNDEIEISILEEE